MGVSTQSTWVTLRSQTDHIMAGSVALSLVGLLCAVSASTFEANYRPFVNFGNNYRGFGGYKTFFSRSSDSSFRDFYTNARDYSKYVRDILRDVSSNTYAEAAVDKFLKNNDYNCISSLEEGVRSIERAVSLLDTNRASVEDISRSVETFLDLKDPIKILRESSRLLRLLQPLYNSDRGEADFDLEKMRCLAVMMDNLASDKELRLGSRGSGELRQTAVIISATTSFMQRLRRQFRRLDNICSDSDRQLNADSILAIGDLSDDIADLYVALGSLQTGEKIRSGKKNLLRVTGELSKIKDLGPIEIECNSSGDFSKAARRLEELANLIEDIGLDKLEEQLGIDLSFLS